MIDQLAIGLTLDVVGLLLVYGLYQISDALRCIDITLAGILEELQKDINDCGQKEPKDT